MSMRRTQAPAAARTAPARAAAAPRAAAPAGSGNWIISPKTNFPIKVTDAQGQTGKKYQELLDDPKFRAAAEAETRYPDAESARPEAQRRRDAVGGVTRDSAGKVLERARKSRPDVLRVAWFDTVTKRVHLKDPNFRPGAGSSLKHRTEGSTEDEAKEAAKVAAFNAGDLKTKPDSLKESRRGPQKNATWVRGGKGLASGERAWIQVGGAEYNKRIAAGETALRDLPTFSTAQKKSQSASAQKVSPSKKAASAAERDRRIAGIRPQAGEFTLCVVNPDTNKAIGVRRGSGPNATTTGNARLLAKKVGGEAQATSKSNGQYTVTDARIIQIIENLVAQGKLKQASGSKKCGGRQ